jgi:hypothetical protein
VMTMNQNQFIEKKWSIIDERQNEKACRKNS